LPGTRFGVFGGTFNPIHNGHLHIAQRVESALGLDRTLFVVATTPPHKSVASVLSFHHRYGMVCLATASFARFVPAMTELEAPPSPYSIDTIAKLERSPALKGGTFYFIAGTDVLPDLKNWYRGWDLLSGCNFVFVIRPDVGRAGIESVLPKAVRVTDLAGLSARRAREQVLADEKCGQKRIYLLDVNAPDISASRIRALAAAGKPIGRLVPGPVYSYIRKTHLYGEYGRHAQDRSQGR
jgi:nicotinate-nucleotide adenylyltransferase